MGKLKTVAIMLLVCSTICSFSQKISKAKPTVDNRTPIQKLSSFFYNLAYLCSRYEDNNLKQLLADNLKNNKAFLKEWEFGLNDPQAQIWQAMNSLLKSPYVIDSSNKAKIICKMPFIKDDKKVAGSTGILQIVPKDALDVENEHDIIHAEPDAQSKAIGKVKPGEQYAHFHGSTAYSPTQKKYVAGFYKDESEAGMLYQAIVLDAATHKLGYISTDATCLSYPVMQLQYIGSQWKITKLAYL